jgi:hypothetical protein
MNTKIGQADRQTKEAEVVYEAQQLDRQTDREKDSPKDKQKDDGRQTDR